MYKYAFILFLNLLFLANGNLIFAQNKYVDSLKNELNKKNLPDSTRIDLLFDLGWNYSMIKADSARFIIEQGIALAAKTKDTNKVGQGYTYIGTNFLRIDKYDSALYYYGKADSVYRKSNSPLAKINLCINKMSVATALSSLGYYEEAIQTQLQGVDTLMHLDFDKKQTTILSAYCNIGNIYNETGEYEKMLYYYKKALSLCDKENIADTKKAQVLILVALANIKLNRYQDALIYLKEADTLDRKINSPYIYSFQYAVLGKYYRLQNNYDSALAVNIKGLQYAKQSNNKFQEAIILNETGIIYYDLKKYQDAVHAFEQSLSVSRETGDKTREIAALDYLAKLYTETKNNDKAVYYYQSYIHLKDSMDAADSKKQVAEIENKYKNKQKTDSILVLQKTAQVQQLELHKKKTVNALLIAGCGMLLLLAGLLYTNFKRKNQLLKQSEILQAQRIAELQKEQQLLAMQSVLKGQEAERSRLAKDLHDGVGGLLSGVKLSLSTMKGNVFLSEANARAVGVVLDQLDQSINELRRVSHNMMPEALIKFGLKEALENYCRNIDLSSKIKVQLQTYGMEQRMEQNTEIVIYRIVQELLNNVIKHAGAKNVLVQLIREKDRFSLTVEDDGKGFNPAAERTEGAGLANVRARAEYLNGTVDIHSSPGEGTSVNVEGSCV